MVCRWGGRRSLPDESRDDPLYAVLPSPIGELLVYGDGDRIAGIHFVTSAYAPKIGRHWRRSAVGFAAAAEQLDEYFGGARTGFDLPLREDRGTPFFHEVWRALERVPYGTTTTYAAIASEIGGPAALGRWVGQTRVTRCRLWCHVIVSLAPRPAFADTRAA